MTKQMIKLGKKHAIRGFDVDWENGRMFVADHDNGCIHQYSIQQPISPDSLIEEVSTFTGTAGPRVVKWWEDREEIYVGHKNGKMSVYELDNFTSGPICKSSPY